MSLAGALYFPSQDIEFALILPVLVFALVGLIDYSLLVYNNNDKESAARTGAQYGMDDETSATDTAPVPAAALAALRDSTGVTATVALAHLCPVGTAVAYLGVLCIVDVVPDTYFEVQLDLNYSPLFGLVVSDPTPSIAVAKLKYE